MSCRCTDVKAEGWNFISSSCRSQDLSDVMHRHCGWGTGLSCNEPDTSEEPHGVRRPTSNPSYHSARDVVALIARGSVN